MKLSKRIKQLIFGSAWADVFVTALALLLNVEIGFALLIANVIIIGSFAVLSFFWATYQIFCRD